MKPLLVAWGVIAILIIGVRIGHGFGYSDALEEFGTPRRRELGEVARWLDPALVRRRRQRAALAVSLLLLASGITIWLR